MCRLRYVSLFKHTVLTVFCNILSLGLFRNRGAHTEGNFIGEREKPAVFFSVPFPTAPPAAEQSVQSPVTEGDRYLSYAALQVALMPLKARTKLKATRQRSKKYYGR